MKPSVLDFKLEMKISQRIPKPEKPRTKNLSNPTSTSTKSGSTAGCGPWPCHRVTQLAHGVGWSWTQNHWEQGHFYPTKGLTSNLYMVAGDSRPLMVYCQPWNFGVHHLHIFSQRRFAQVVLSCFVIFSDFFCQFLPSARLLHAHSYNFARAHLIDSENYGWTIRAPRCFTAGAACATWWAPTK